MDKEKGNVQKYYVDCIANTFSQYPVVRTVDKIIARNFKGYMFDEAESRAIKLAGILNSCLIKYVADKALVAPLCEYCHTYHFGYEDHYLG